MEIHNVPWCLLTISLDTIKHWLGSLHFVVRVTLISDPAVILSHFSFSLPFSFIFKRKASACFKDIHHCQAIWCSGLICWQIISQVVCVCEDSIFEYHYIQILATKRVIWAYLNFMKGQTASEMKERVTFFIGVCSSALYLCWWCGTWRLPKAFLSQQASEHCLCLVAWWQSLEEDSSRRSSASQCAADPSTRFVPSLVNPAARFSFLCVHPLYGHLVWASCLPFHIWSMDPVLPFHKEPAVSSCPCPDGLSWSLPAIPSSVPCVCLYHLSDLAHDGFSEPSASSLALWIQIKNGLSTEQAVARGAVGLFFP